MRDNITTFVFDSGGVWEEMEDGGLGPGVHSYVVWGLDIECY